MFCAAIQLIVVDRVEKNHDFYFFKSDFFYLNRIYLIFLNYFIYLFCLKSGI